jgi:glycosyltransferase involved in cell wall biosynthesis
MAARLPTVAYGVGGNVELINKERGTLVSAGDEEAFAAAVTRLLTSPSMRSQLGDNAYKFVEDNFSLENVRAKYEACYQSLLEKKGVRTPLGSWRPTTEAQKNG